MKIVYTIVIIIGLFQLIGIQVALSQIAAAYIVWAKSIEKQDNPLIVADAEELGSK